MKRISTSAIAKCHKCRGQGYGRTTTEPTVGKWRGCTVAAIGPCGECANTGLDAIPWTELFAYIRIQQP